MVLLGRNRILLSFILCLSLFSHKAYSQSNGLIFKDDFDSTASANFSELATYTGKATDMALVPDEELYLILLGEQKVAQLINTSGKIINSFELPEAQLPQGIAVDRERNVYVTDTQRNQILRFTLTGNWSENKSSLVSNGVYGQAGKADGEFDNPYAISISPQISGSRIFVTDTGNKRIQIFERDGRFVKSISEGLDNPLGLIATATGGIVVSDLVNNKVLILDDYGKILSQTTLKQFSETTKPLHSKIDEGNTSLFIVTPGAVVLMNKLGKVLQKMDFEFPITAAFLQITQLGDELLVLTRESKSRLLRVQLQKSTAGLSPVETVKRFHSAILKRDFQMARTYMTARLQKKFDAILDDPEKVNALVEMVTRLENHIETFALENMSTVTSFITGTPNRTPVDVILVIEKATNTWKIDQH